MLQNRVFFMFFSLSLIIFLKLKCLMQSAYRVFHLRFFHDTGDSYLRCGYQLDIYSFIAECLEHAGSITGSILHPGTDNTYLSQLGIADAIPGADRFTDRFDDFKCFLQISFRYRECKVSDVLDARVLD